MVRTTRAVPDNSRGSLTGERGAHGSVASEPISEEERAVRRALMERMLVRRNEQEYLDIPSDQLVREARAEAYGPAEQ